MTKARGSLLAAMAAAVFGGGAVVLALWLLVKHLSLPAFNTSMVTRSLATSGSTVILIAAGCLLYWYPQAPTWRRRLTQAIATLAPGLLVFTSIGIPLSASRLYLDGVQVDQGFRTQFLTRMADTTALADMNYADMPTYYPAGWFWLGGRLANLLGIPGWEVFQPWALISIAAAGCLLVPVWQRLTGSLATATAVAITSIAVVLRLGADEPYAVIVALGVPAAAALAWRGLSGSRFAALGLLTYLGLSATIYTLFTALGALTVVIASIILAARTRSPRPILRMISIGIGSCLIALLSWGPYLLAVATGHPRGAATATHFLPEDGTTFPLPFLHPSIAGILSLLGIVYLVTCHRDRLAAPLITGIAVAYAWTLGSMALPMLGTTALGFRMELPIFLYATTAGILGVAWIAQLQRNPGRLATATITIVAIVAGLHYIQAIPKNNQEQIDHAYSDTDGNGERADRYPPDVGRYYARIDQIIHDDGLNHDAIILTDETRLLSYYPYFGYQAFTSHYANPLGQFEERNATIADLAERSWTDLADPDDFAAAITDAPWRAPDVYIFRGHSDDPDDTAGYKIHIAEDIYPNEPNIRYQGLFFNPAVFDADSLWRQHQVGPFVVITRSAP